MKVGNEKSASGQHGAGWELKFQFFDTNQTRSTGKLVHNFPVDLKRNLQFQPKNVRQKTLVDLKKFDLITSPAIFSSLICGF